MKKGKKHLIVRVVVVLFLVFAAAAALYWIKIQKEKPLCPRCNIVLIDIDILRADALPCYGYKRNTAPNICDLANKSQRFDNNYAQAHWTLPSVISTITSLYPSAHGVWASYKNVLSPNVITLAQQLKYSGYKTLYFGPSHPSVLTDLNGGTRGYDVVQSLSIEQWEGEIRKLFTSSQPFFAHFYNADLHMPYTINDAAELLEPMVSPADFPTTHTEFSAMLGRYLLKNYTKVFTPLAINERPDLFSTSNGRDASGILEYYWSFVRSPDPERITGVGWPAQFEAYMQAINSNINQTKPYVRLLYDSVLFTRDKKLDPFLKYLLSGQLSSNTVVVFYSDHGEEFGERGRFSHLKSVYNEIIKTPLFIYVPTLAPRSYSLVSQNIDIFPSIMGAVGIKSPKNIHGSSLIDSMTGKRLASFRSSISQAGPGFFSIVNGKWKLIINNINNPLVGAELYFLSMDPGETNNVIAGNLSVAQSLLAELSKMLEEDVAR